MTDISPDMADSPATLLPQASTSAAEHSEEVVTTQIEDDGHNFTQTVDITAAEVDTTTKIITQLDTMTQFDKPNQIGEPNLTKHDTPQASSPFRSSFDSPSSTSSSDGETQEERIARLEAYIDYYRAGAAEAAAQVQALRNQIAVDSAAIIGERDRALRKVTSMEARIRALKADKNTPAEQLATDYEEQRERADTAEARLAELKAELEMLRAQPKPTRSRPTRAQPTRAGKRTGAGTGAGITKSKAFGGRKRR